MGLTAVSLAPGGPVRAAHGPTAGSHLSCQPADTSSSQHSWTLPGPRAAGAWGAWGSSGPQESGIGGGWWGRCPGVGPSAGNQGPSRPFLGVPERALDQERHRMLPRASSSTWPPLEWPCSPVTSRDQGAQAEPSPGRPGGQSRALRDWCLRRPVPSWTSSLTAQRLQLSRGTPLSFPLRSEDESRPAVHASDPQA